MWGFSALANAPTPATSYAPLQAFRQGLDELGYVHGRNVVIETRWAEGRIDQLPALAAELVGLRVDILVGVGAVVARAFKSATTTIPVVIAVVIDPVNLVAERPGGNLTVLTTFDPQEVRKKLALLQEVVPGLARVASSGIKRCGTRRGMQSRHVHWVCSRRVFTIAGASPDLEAVFQAIKTEHADALLVLELPATVIHRKRIAELAAQQRLPTFVCGGLVGRRGAARLWHQGHRGGAAPGGLRGPDCQGGAARRPAFRGRRAPRADRQPQDGAGDWRHDPARGAQAGRPGHTMRGSATSSTIGATELPNHRLQRSPMSVLPEIDTTA